jgi:uncharacterized RDD family membrane protein YckC
MATATKKAVSLPERPKKKVKVVGFEPTSLRAPFFLRCAAFAIDYLVLIAIPVVWLLLSRPLSDSGASQSIAPAAWIAGIILALLNEVILPLWNGKTVGKMLTGLTIVEMDGTPIGLSSLLRRNILGYLLTALTLGIGFLISGINSSGRALHDLVGGTIVVRARRKLV